MASGRQQAQRRTAWKHGAGRAGTQSALGMAGGAAESLPTLGCRKSPAAGEIHLGRWGAGPYGGGAPGGGAQPTRALAAAAAGCSRCKRSGTERTRIAHTLTADTSEPSEVSPAELGREFQAPERPR